MTTNVTTQNSITYGGDLSLDADFKTHGANPINLTAPAAVDLALPPSGLLEVTGHRDIASGSVVLTALDAGKFILAQAPSVITLPAASDLLPGQMIKIAVYGSSTSATTVQVPAGPTRMYALPGSIISGGEKLELSTILIDRGDSIFLESDGVSAFNIVGGTVALRYASSFGTYGIGTPPAAFGFQYLPTGFIIQWGVSQSIVGVQTQSFPVAFPRACFFVCAKTSTPGLVVDQVHTFNTNSFGWSVRDVSNVLIGGISATFFAIGC